MNYTKIYEDFISSRKELNKTRTIQHGNVHHILATCCGGMTTDDNLIKLTYKEHLFAHIVLYKKYKQSNDKRYALSMLYALCKLTYLPRSAGKIKNILSCGLKKHEQKYTKYISGLSDLMTGKNNPNYGNKWNDEQKENQRLNKLAWNKAHNNWNPMDNPEYRNKISQANSGMKNGNAKHYKLILQDGTEYDIYPPVKKNTKLLTGIDYQQFYQKLDAKTRLAPKYGAKLIED